MTLVGSHWIIFQRRIDGKVNFTRNWKEYKEGFGDVSTSYWLGLDLVHYLCGSSLDKCSMRVDLKYKGTDYYAKYQSFYLDSERDNFRLHISGYSGTAGDSLGMTDNSKWYIEYFSHDGMPFSIYDRDYDR